MAQARPGLMRSSEHRVLAGVCGGLAEWLGWSPGLVRTLFVLVSLPLREDEPFPLEAR